jgi:hypothetical protein
LSECQPLEAAPQKGTAIAAKPELVVVEAAFNGRLAGSRGVKSCRRARSGLDAAQVEASVSVTVILQ